MKIQRSCSMQLCALVALGLFGCGEGLGDPTGSTCPPASTLTYENFGESFIATNCLRCHRDDESPRLNSLREVQTNADAIDRAAASGPDATNKFMPEDQDIAESERKKLGEWLACGAP